LDAVDLANNEGAEISIIPVVTKARGTSMEDITIGLVTSNSGAALKPLEIAKVCKRLVGYQMDVKDIAARLTLTPAYVNQLLDLLAAPKAVRELVANGTIAATLAMDTLKKHGKDAAKMLTAGVKEAKVTGKTRVTAKHVKAATAPKTKLAKGKSSAKAQKAAQEATPSTTAPTDTDNLLELGRVWIEENQTGHAPEMDRCKEMLAFLAGVPIAQVQALFPAPAAGGADDEQL
jgi:hypothetical protein